MIDTPTPPPPFPLPPPQQHWEPLLLSIRQLNLISNYIYKVVR